MNLENKLTLDTPWSVGEAAFSQILTVIGKASPRSILEFGSGASSVRLALAFPEASILSVDHNEKFFSRTNELAKHSGVKNLEIIQSPIRKRWFGAARYESYDVPGFHDQNFDVVLIDGPPSHFLFGREACLYNCYENIRKGGIVILDDFARPIEQLTVRNWQKRYPNSFDLATHQIGHGIAILHKRNHHRFSLSVSVPYRNVLEWRRRDRNNRIPNIENRKTLGLIQTVFRTTKRIVQRIPILHRILKDLRTKYHSIYEKQTRLDK